MHATTTPNAARGEVTITLDGQPRKVRISLNVLRDWTKLTGRAASEFGQALVEDYVEAFSGVLMCAVRRFVSGAEHFTQDQAVDLLEEMSQAEADNVAEALTEATTTVNPLLASMSKQMAAKTQGLLASTPAENGTAGNTSLTASSN